MVKKFSTTFDTTIKATIVVATIVDRFDLHSYLKYHKLKTKKKLTY